jgi:RNA polymerase sigma-70 factor (ECF subfamily)
METEEQIKVMLSMIDQLPGKQKIALTLSKLENLPYKEVAEIMDISVSETGVLINRAKNKLQKRLSNYFKKME